MYAIWRVKASKQSFVMNQNFVLLPSVSENFTATSPTLIVSNNAKRPNKRK